MDMDLAYANSAFIAGGDTYLAKWEGRAAAFRTGLGARAELGLAYGPGARQQFDLFHPVGDARGLMVFIHGGYWMATDRSLWSHLAAGAVERGWACAMPSYTLAPEARISAMTAEIVLAVQAAVARVPGPLVVTGHSAGGHLAARMGCLGVVAGAIARVVPVSPLAELSPLAKTAMNAVLQLDEAEITSESPARLAVREDVQAHVWVGGQERPAFLWQARMLSEAWGCGWTVDPGHHHFDVIDGYRQPDSGLMQACLGGI